METLFNREIIAEYNLNILPNSSLDLALEHESIDNIFHYLDEARVLCDYAEITNTRIKQFSSSTIGINRKDIEITQSLSIDGDICFLEDGSYTSFVRGDTAPTKYSYMLWKKTRTAPLDVLPKFSDEEPTDSMMTIGEMESNFILRNTTADTTNAALSTFNIISSIHDTSIALSKLNYESDFYKSDDEISHTGRRILTENVSISNNEIEMLKSSDIGIISGVTHSFIDNLPTIKSANKEYLKIIDPYFSNSSDISSMVDTNMVTQSESYDMVYRNKMLKKGHVSIDPIKLDSESASTISVISNAISSGRDIGSAVDVDSFVSFGELSDLLTDIKETIDSIGNCE